MIASKYFSGSDIDKGKADQVSLDVPEQKAGKKYLITVQNISDKTGNIKIFRACTDALDLYEGKTQVNGETQKGCLLIDAYHK